MSTAAPALLRRLVISPNWIGDAVMAQPLLALLRERDPQRPIDVLAPPWVAPVWRAMSQVETVIDAPFRHGALQLRERWSVAQDLRRRGYGEAYVLPNTLKFALIPWLAGIARRIGYCGEHRYGLINVMHADDRATPRPMISYYGALAAKPASDVAQPAALPRPVLQVSDMQKVDVALFFGLRATSPLIIFAPGAEFGSAKRWPTAHFAQLARNIRETHLGAQIVLMGSVRDKCVCDEIVAMAPAVRNLAGMTSLDQAIAVIAQAKAIVSNDSGLLHIASGVNCPIVALYGPTEPSHAPPFSDIAVSLSLRLGCAPCRQRECPLGHHNCMQNLQPDIVLQPLTTILDARIALSSQDLKSAMADSAVDW